MKAAKELIVGQRYWLDRSKDVSGVYIGDNIVTGGPIFKEIEGLNIYESEDSDGSVRFATKNNFFLVES
jgi:hypothetical protein